MIIGIGTGRCGTMSIAELLGLPHEPKPGLIKESIQYHYEPIKYPPQEILLRRALGNKGAVNHRYGLLIEPLHRLYPDAKWVFIIRSGPETVSSFNRRRWYSPDSLLGHEEWRLRGDKIGEFSSPAWGVMTPFEKCCWHWAYFNNWMYAELERLNVTYTMVYIETVNSDDLHQWAWDKPAPRFLTHRNGAAWRAPRDLETWTKDQWHTFNRFAGDIQRKFYADTPHAAQEIPMYNEIVLAPRR